MLTLFVISKFFTVVAAFKRKQQTKYGKHSTMPQHTIMFPFTASLIQQCLGSHPVILITTNKIFFAYHSRKSIFAFYRALALQRDCYRFKSSLHRNELWLRAFPQNFHPFPEIKKGIKRMLETKREKSFHFAYVRLETKMFIKKSPHLPHNF